MAVEILIGHIPATAATAALAQVHAEHAALYAGVEPADEPHPARQPGGELAEAAVRSLDPPQVKLVEACRRGLAATGDPAFPAAAATVTGLRCLDLEAGTSPPQSYGSLVAILSHSR